MSRPQDRQTEREDGRTEEHAISPLSPVGASARVVPILSFIYLLTSGLPTVPVPVPVARSSPSTSPRKREKNRDTF